MIHVQACLEGIDLQCDPASVSTNCMYNELNYVQEAMQQQFAEVNSIEPFEVLDHMEHVDHVSDSSSISADDNRWACSMLAFVCPVFGFVAVACKSGLQVLTSCCTVGWCHMTACSRTTTCFIRQSKYAGMIHWLRMGH